MPYKSKADLPKQVQGLPDHAKSIFMSAFNAAYEEYGEERAFQIAWSAVKNKYKKEGDKWVKKTDAEMHDSACVFSERMEIDFDDATNWRLTDSGFLVCRPRIARTGIQKYKGYEVGFPELDEVSVYRPEGEVFSNDALRSFAHKPVTMDHPPEFVGADNWKQYAIGQTGDEVARDGDFIRVPLVLMDGNAIKDVKAGKKQLSAGYGARLVWGKGKTPKGESYDAMQTQIRDNHVAVCAAARGGPMLCLGDSFAPIKTDSPKPSPENRRKRMKTITIDSIQIEVEDDTKAAVIERTFQRQADELKTLNDKLTASTALTTDLQKQVGTKDGEIVALKKAVEDAKLSPAQIEQLVNDRTELCNRARFVLGDSFDTRGKTNIEIMRAVCQQKLGDEAKTMADAPLEGAFKVITAEYKPGQQLDGVRQMSYAFNGPGPVNDAAKAYDARSAQLESQWQNPNGQTKQ